MQGSVIDIRRPIEGRQFSRKSSRVTTASEPDNPGSLTPEARDRLRRLAHELRTPLGAVITLAELIQREEYGPIGNPKYREYAECIVAGASHALEVLALTLEADASVPYPEPPLAEPVDVGALARTCASLLAPMANAAGVAVAVRPVEAQAIVRTDATRLQQVLVNLVGNAIKFTPVGGSVALAVDAAADGGIALAVADNGIGVTPLVTQSTVGAATDAPARGLGLTLVRQLAKDCGATFTFESERGKGTTATLRFPRERTGQP